MDNSPNLVSLSKRNPFELFFELSADLLCIAGFDGYFKQINPAVSQLLGFSNEELLSRPINDFVFEDDKEITGKVRSELVKGNPLFHFENRYVTKSGEIVWLSWTSMNIDSEQKVFAIAKNITHKKRLEEERNKLLVNMTTVNKELKQLTYTTSHDLRAPVNNLLAIFDLLDVSKINDEETLDLIHILKDASEHLKNTLNDYVDILTTQKNASIQIEEIVLNDALDKVTKSIASLIKNSRTTIEADFSKLETVYFNRDYLHSILLNLLSNSIKYARTDCWPIISLTSQRVDGVSQLIVVDNGIGFDMDKVKDKIFGLQQKFHQHSDSKGIGLYLVHTQIVTLGGTISLDSKINEGSKFTISFKN